MVRYSTELRARKYVKGYECLSFARNLSNTYKKQLLDAGLDPLKTASKNVDHKTGEVLGNKSYDNKIVTAKPVEEIVIPPG